MRPSLYYCYERGFVGNPELVFTGRNMYSLEHALGQHCNRGERDPKRPGAAVDLGR